MGEQTGIESKNSSFSFNEEDVFWVNKKTTKREKQENTSNQENTCNQELVSNLKKDNIPNIINWEKEKINFPSEIINSILDEDFYWKIKHDNLKEENKKESKLNIEEKKQWENISNSKKLENLLDIYTILFKKIIRQTNSAYEYTMDNINFFFNKLEEKNIIKSKNDFKPYQHLILSSPDLEWNNWPTDKEIKILEHFLFYIAITIFIKTHKDNKLNKKELRKRQEEYIQKEIIKKFKIDNLNEKIEKIKKTDDIEKQINIVKQIKKNKRKQTKITKLLKIINRNQREKIIDNKEQMLFLFTLQKKFIDTLEEKGIIWQKSFCKHFIIWSSYRPQITSKDFFIIKEYIKYYTHFMKKKFQEKENIDSQQIQEYIENIL